MENDIDTSSSSEVNSYAEAARQGGKSAGHSSAEAIELHSDDDNDVNKEHNTSEFIAENLISKFFGRIRGKKTSKPKGKLFESSMPAEITQVEDTPKPMSTRRSAKRKLGEIKNVAVAKKPKKDNKLPGTFFTYQI
jgi:hypothetical protein